MKKLTALILSFVFMFSLAGCETNFEKEKALMEKGPWSNEAIWVDENSQLYLICTKDNNNQFADVMAYWSVDDKWRSAQLHLYQGAPIALFVTPDDERVLEARAKMNDKSLQLYEFKTYNKNFTPKFNDIKLSKFSYQEQIDKLPFENMQ